MNIFNPGAPESAERSDATAAFGAAMCSRKGCREHASWQLLWNNPRIHTPERRKVWVACVEHRDWLEDYLQTRGLWKETLPLDARPVSGGAN